MSATFRGLIVLCLFGLLSACAAGNRYSYDSGEIVLPVNGPGDIGLLIIDRRPYVLSGDKSASFVGLQRGGFGNPFDVKTESGQPLAEEMQTRLSRSLESYGFTVHELVAAGSSDDAVQKAILLEGYDRNLIIIMDEWKSDAMASFGLSYNLELNIKSDKAITVASNRIQGNKERLGGAGFEGANSNSAKRAFETKMNELFSSPDIRAQMQTGN